MIALSSYYLKLTQRKMMIFAAVVFLMAILVYVEGNYGAAVIGITSFLVFLFAETVGEHQANFLFEKTIPLKQRNIVLSKYLVFLIVVSLIILLTNIYFAFVMQFAKGDFDFRSHNIFLKHILSIMVCGGVCMILLCSSDKKPQTLFILLTLTSLVFMASLQVLLSTVDFTDVIAAQTGIETYFWQNTSMHDLLIASLFFILSYPLAIYLQQRK